MLFFWNNEFLRPLTQLGLWLFGNNENEVLTLDATGERHVDAYGSEGSPFARLLPDLHSGAATSGPEEDPLHRLYTQRQRGAKGAPLRGGSVQQHSGEHTSSHGGPAEGRGTAGGWAAYLSTDTLLAILDYRLEASPLPLAVAAAGPRLRLAGEMTSVLYFPGAASSVRGVVTSPSPPSMRATHGPSSASADAAWHTTETSATSHSSFLGCRIPLSCMYPTEWSPTPRYTRRLRGTSLLSLTASMRRSAWWYARATPALLHGEHDGDPHSDEEEAEGQFSSSRPLCLPLCVEVVAPRGVAASTAANTRRASASSSGSFTHPLVGWVLRPASALGLLRGGSGAQSAHGAPFHLPPLDEELQSAVHNFVVLLDQLWCVRRCPLIELSMECYPTALTEWILSPDLHPDSTARAVAPSASAGDSPTSSPSASGRADALVRVRRAFGHVEALRCRGRVGHASAEAMSAATAVARGAATAVSHYAGGSFAALAVSLSATAGAYHGAGGLPFLSFTAVRARLRVLDLSGTTLTSLDGIEFFPLLERVTLTGCARLNSLSPLGMAPSLCEIVASQSGIYELEGLAHSRSLVSLSLYGCLNLTDVSACGRVPTLRDLFISESTVEVVEGLRDSRSLVRLGMRYCDLPSLTALTAVATLRILHAASSSLASVAALQFCPSLEVVEVAACGQLLDLGSLGLAPSLVEVDATGSGVRHVDGLCRSTSLEKLRLAHCSHLEEVGRLGLCVRLRHLSLTGTAVRSLEGLAGAPALSWLDVSFCRQLGSLSVLLHLPELRRVLVRGCTAALRHPEEVRVVVESLGARRKKVEVVEG